MAHRFFQRFLVAPVAWLALTSVPALRGQAASEAPVIHDAGVAPAASGTSLPLRLDLSRRDVANFLTDEEALAPYRSEDGKVSGLRDLFMIGSVNAPYAIFWDPETCRLVGILDIEAPGEAPPSERPDPGKDASDPPAPSPYLLKATGPMPLSKTSGASGAARFFGFRLVNGAPEFLYHCGALSVEERLWLDEGGKVLRQRLSVKGAPSSLQIAVPPSWANRVSASVGKWKGALLTVPKESTGEVVLTYPLSRPSPSPSDPESPTSDSN